RCGVGTLTLSATAGAGTSVNWYDSLTGGKLLAWDSANFTTPAIGATTTFYAAASMPGNPDSIAVPLANANTTGLGELMFMVEAYSSLLVNSISTKCGNAVNAMTSWKIYYRPDNYQQTTGANTSPNGWILLDSVYNVPSKGSANYTEIVNNLGLVIPAGRTYSFYISPGTGTTQNYGSDPMGMVVESNQDADIIAGHRGSTPFNLTTASGVPSVKFKYIPGCEGTRVPVVATVTTPPAYTVSASADSVCEGSSVTL